MAELGESSGRRAEEDDGTESIEVHECAWGPGDPTVTAPRVLWSTHHERTKKKLVLHVDLNNTILVSDAVTCQGTVAALDCFLTTVTWGKKSRHGKVDLMVLFSVTQECWKCVLSGQLMRGNLMLLL